MAYIMDGMDDFGRDWGDRRLFPLIRGSGQGGRQWRKIPIDSASFLGYNRCPIRHHGINTVTSAIIEGVWSREK
jgi:hypothetical protein